MRGDRTLAHLIAPIDDLLNNPQVTDICINRPYEVFARIAGMWEIRAIPSFSFDLLDAATILIGQRTGREFDENSCYVNSTMPGGQRFQGVRPPGTKNGRILWAIRRPPAVARKIDDDDFAGLFLETNRRGKRHHQVKGDMLDQFNARNWKAFFRGARLAGLSIAFCGPTGSGKSDLARRCIQISRPGARMVTIETDDEFGEVGPENKASLFYDDTRITSDEAVRIALRLVPVEIALQEVRGAEAYSLLRAMSSGHNGVTTWHAESGRELEALAMMARMHPAGRDLEENRLVEMARRAFDIIAYCERSDNGFSVSNVRLTAQEENSE